MPGGAKTAISGIGIFYPDGTETQRKGVKIDIEITPTIKGIQERRDEILDKALWLIENKNEK
jgi:carboxyl-terminal processing protease